MELGECLEKRKLLRMQPNESMALKEIEAAKYDLDKAENSLKEKDPKWAIIKSYYSMFHASRALIILEGFRERKNHECLIKALKELYVKTGKLDALLVEWLKFTKIDREDADYNSKYSEEVAQEAVGRARKFIQACTPMLKI